MKKVDIVNCLYHAIMSEELGGQSCDFRYAKLQSILETGYLYSVSKIVEHDIRFAYPHKRGINSDEYICLGCNPNSEISIPYSNLNIHKGESNGYTMSQLSFGFVLDKSLITELETIPGCYDYEIFVKGEIPIDKYALGIFNAGGMISKDVYVYREFIKYFNGEIDKFEYARRASEITGREVWFCDWYMNNETKSINGRSVYFKDYIENAIMQDYMALITKNDRYMKIKQILERCGSNLPILDDNGEEIPPLEQQKAKILSLFN